MLYIDYGRTYKKLLNLKNPLYFGEKIQWLKLHGNLERYSKYVDKYEVRTFVKERIGDKYLNTLLGIYNNPADINFKILPQKFVLKSTNGCGCNFICKDKGTLDIKKTIKILNKWIKIDYYKYTKEIQYKNIKTRILCEEYLEDESGSLRDYKFHCAGGDIFLIEVLSDRSNDLNLSCYDLNWNYYDISCSQMGKGPIIEKPPHLNEMANIVQSLSEGFKYVRVDLYSLKKKIIFGELTMTPGNGMDVWYPLEKDLELAKNIKL